MNEEHAFRMLNEIILIRNYIGNCIDNPMKNSLTMEECNELWQWIDTLLEEVE